MTEEMQCFMNGEIKEQGEAADIPTASALPSFLFQPAKLYKILTLARPIFAKNIPLDEKIKALVEMLELVASFTSTEKDDQIIKKIKEWI